MKMYIEAKSTLHAIHLIKGDFTPNEFLELITANFYSTLFYRSEMWLLPNLNPTSTAALKLCAPSYNRTMSHIQFIVEQLHLK
jgi:hypothetical protein